MDNDLRPCSPVESLRQSLKEMEQIRSGQAARRDINEVLDELEREIEHEGD